MADMTPDEMSELQQMAGKGSDGGATKLAQQVGQGLSQLQEMLSKSPGVTDQDIQQMDQIISMFVDLVEKKLGGTEPGKDAPDESEQMSQIPSDAGVSGKPMGPQTRN